MNIHKSYNLSLTFEVVFVILLSVTTYLKSSLYEASSQSRDILTGVQITSLIAILITAFLILKIYTNNKKKSHPSSVTVYEKLLTLASFVLIAATIIFILVFIGWVIAILSIDL